MTIKNRLHDDKTPYNRFKKCKKNPLNISIGIFILLGSFLEDEHISDVLCGKDIGLPADVVETITSATKQHASNILNQLRELQVDLRSNPAIFVGGGSILLRPFLEDSPMVLRGSFVDSPNANAVGYEMLGRTQMLRPNA